MKVAKRRNELIAAAGLTMFSVLYAGGSLMLKIGQMKNPGSGFMPVIISGLLLICSFSYLFAVLRSQPVAKTETTEEDPDSSPVSHTIPVAIAGLALVYPFILMYLGFLLSTFLVIWPIMVLMRYKGVVISGIIAVVMVIATFILFSVGLGVVLPSGTIEQFIVSM